MLVIGPSQAYRTYGKQADFGDIEEAAWGAPGMPSLLMAAAVKASDAL